MNTTFPVNGWIVKLPVLLFLLAIGAGPGCQTAPPPRFEGVYEPPVYRLRPGDTVTIEVFREPELSGTFRLNADGVIRHPILADLALMGLTEDVAETVVRRRLASNYLVNPRVLLKIESTVGAQVTIMGEVRNPGVRPMARDEPLTLIEAIAAAGGFTPLASPNRVRVVRTVDGRQVTIRVRVADVMAGRGRDRDILLRPDDLITIPEIRF